MTYKYKVGDYVQIKSSRRIDHFNHKDKIGVITKVGDYGYKINSIDETLIFLEEELLFMPFKPGDRVKLSPDSQFYCDYASNSNPKEEFGTITKIRNCVSLPICVDWDNQTHNVYNIKDLIFCQSDSKGDPKRSDCVPVTFDPIITISQESLMVQKDFLETDIFKPKKDPLEFDTPVILKRPRKPKLIISNY